MLNHRHCKTDIIGTFFFFGGGVSLYCCYYASLKNKKIKSLEKKLILLTSAHVCYFGISAVLTLDKRAHTGSFHPLHQERQTGGCSL